MTYLFIYFFVYLFTYLLLPSCPSCLPSYILSYSLYLLSLLIPSLFSYLFFLPYSFHFFYPFLESGPGVSSIPLEEGMELLAEYKMKITKLIKTKAELINAQNLFDLGENYFISNIYDLYFKLGESGLFLVLWWVVISCIEINYTYNW